MDNTPSTVFTKKSMSIIPDYTPKEQLGTGSRFNNDLLECVLTTLNVRADQDLQRNKAKEINS